MILPFSVRATPLKPSHHRNAAASLNICQMNCRQRKQGQKKHTFPNKESHCTMVATGCCWISKRPSIPSSLKHIVQSMKTENQHLTFYVAPDVVLQYTNSFTCSNMLYMSLFYMCSVYFQIPG